MVAKQIAMNDIVGANGIECAVERDSYGESCSPAPLPSRNTQGARVPCVGPIRANHRIRPDKALMLQ